MDNDDIRCIVSIAMTTLYLYHVQVNLRTIQMYLAAQGYYISSEAINQAMQEVFRPPSRQEEARTAASIASLRKWLISLQ